MLPVPRERTFLGQDCASPERCSRLAADGDQGQPERKAQPLFQPEDRNQQVEESDLATGEQPAAQPHAVQLPPEDSWDVEKAQALNAEARSIELGAQLVAPVTTIVFQSAIQRAVEPGHRRPARKKWIPLIHEC